MTDGDFPPPPQGQKAEIAQKIYGCHNILHDPSLEVGGAFSEFCSAGNDVASAN
jgi:hypothetical protein